MLQSFWLEGRHFEDKLAAMEILDIKGVEDHWRLSVSNWVSAMTKWQVEDCRLV
jgi:hypothetical protein